MALGSLACKWLQRCACVLALPLLLAMAAAWSLLGNACNSAEKESVYVCLMHLRCGLLALRRGLGLVLRVPSVLAAVLSTMAASVLFALAVATRDCSVAEIALMAGVNDILIDLRVVCVVLALF